MKRNIILYENYEGVIFKYTVTFSYLKSYANDWEGDEFIYEICKLGCIQII